MELKMFLVCAHVEISIGYHERMKLLLLLYTDEHLNVSYTYIILDISNPFWCLCITHVAIINSLLIFNLKRQIKSKYKHRENHKKKIKIACDYYLVLYFVSCT